MVVAFVVVLVGSTWEHKMADKTAFEVVVVDIQRELVEQHHSMKVHSLVHRIVHMQEHIAWLALEEAGMVEVVLVVQEHNVVVVPIVPLLVYMVVDT